MAAGSAGAPGHPLALYRRVLSRLADGSPEARYEAILAVLRTCLLAVTAITLLLPGSRHLGPAMVNAGLAVISAAFAGAVAGLRDTHLLRLLGRWATAADVLAYAAYTIAFSGQPGAGSLFGIWVLVAGPVRYGMAGVPATVLPVAVVASIWPQMDSAGRTTPIGETVLLCLLFAVPAIVVRAVLMRGSARLRLAERQFSTAFEHASIGMAITSLNLQVVQANRSLAVLLGTSVSELAGRNLDEVADRLDREALRCALRGLTVEAPSVRIEVRLRRPDGGLRWGHVSASLLGASTGVAGRLVVQIENITERKRSEAMLSHAAAHDALTDLPNRSLLLSRLETALAHGEQVGLLFLDLDRFKVVNDGLGHAAGDLLLVQVAIRLRDIMRPEDLVARIGGDEFVVLVRGADPALIADVSDRVLQALSQPIDLASGAEIVAGASIGVAIGGPGDTADHVMRDADTAMYAAKSAGGGRVHIFTPELRDAVVRTHELEVDLRAAVRDGDLTLVYQPVYDVVLGRIVGCEALVRWHHARRGAVRPSDFVAVAEQSDLILELGDFVLREALRTAHTWPAVPGGTAPSVSVNVSLRQLMVPSFVAQIAAALEESRVDASRLCLEVTETVLAGDVEPVISVLTSLRDLGIHLSIDDFGTGHASLTYLARFPVDQVKIDRSFVAGLGSDAGSAAIVGGVIAMAHTFDMRVVAEGVETPAQLTALRDMHCDAVQGFMLSVPRTADELAFVLRRSAAGTLLPEPRNEDDILVPEHAGEAEERRYRLLVEGAKEVTGRLDIDSVMEHAFHALGRAVTFSGGSIMLVEDDQVRIAAGVPAPTADALAARIPLGQGVSGGIASSGEPRYLPDITIASTVTQKRRSKSTSTGVRSWFGVPLICEGRPIGVLQVDSTRVDAFNESDRLAVLSFAPVVALAIVSARHAEAQLRDMQHGR